ncbi:hypothetical protein MBAV_002610 [Candidatus Magnetobacterium bavaricum]|uniref:Uncharacterized protein n=1 Tax=Candidatus Magnetobacterium bavaricum TaxID=29290 RepID=A0A0F3GTJ9_9BACT|nr:hypothetical protein MBAV_002610 [Candidatus Magnetobacterium bavaricum]
MSHAPLRLLISGILIVTSSVLSIFLSKTAMLFTSNWWYLASAEAMSFCKSSTKFGCMPCLS